MKVVQINTVYDRGSTGKICRAVSNLLTEKEIENYILFSSGDSDISNAVSCCTKWYTKGQALKSRILGNYGFNSRMETNRMIGYLERIKPDVVHLHNIHGHDCHLDLLFDYFRRNKIKLIWTFHDCWAFTAYCPHFMFKKCDKWKSECNHCPRRYDFSWFFDRSRIMFERKRKCFFDLDLTIITPSQWLADVVRESFLKEYPVRVIRNGIDLQIFQPTPNQFREEYGIPEEKKILLGVAFGWSVQKGLDVFLELVKRLPCEKYQIVLVGTDNKVDQQLPKSIISIHRTQNQRKLAEIYTAADLFINPTREENYPTVNMEAIACGLPILTFDTGGSKEMLNESVGVAIPADDIDRLEREVLCMCSRKYDKKSFETIAKTYDEKQRFEEYIKLYE